MAEKVLSIEHARLYDVELFTLFNYIHSPEQFDHIRNMRIWDIEAHSPTKVPNHELMRIIEKEFPSPHSWNDLAGFVTFTMDMIYGKITLTGAIWAIRTRKFKRRKLFRNNYDENVTRTMPAALLKDPEAFNVTFWNEIESMLEELEATMSSREIYFSRDENRTNWKLLKSANIASFVIEKIKEDN